MIRKNAGGPLTGIERWISGTWAVFEKDLRLEVRTRYAINALLMFVLSSLLLILFSIGQTALSERVQAALLWIVILFAAAVGLGRSFVSEEEGGTVLLLQLNAEPSMVYTGKLLFNFMLVLSLSVLALIVFIIVLGIDVRMPGLLMVTFLFGSTGLAGATTLLAAVIARTSNRTTLLPVLLFPMLVPLLMAVVSATRIALTGGGWEPASDEILTLVGYSGVMVSASLLLFDFVWKD